MSEQSCSRAILRGTGVASTVRDSTRMSVIWQGTQGGQSAFLMSSKHQSPEHSPSKQHPHARAQTPCPSQSCPSSKSNPATAPRTSASRACPAVLLAAAPAQSPPPSLTSTPRHDPRRQRLASPVPAGFSGETWRTTAGELALRARVTAHLASLVRAGTRSRLQHDLVTESVTVLPVSGESSGGLAGNPLPRSLRPRS